MIPLILGGLVIAAGTATGSYKGIKAYKKFKKAKNTIEKFEERVNNVTQEFQKMQNKLQNKLTELDNIYLNVYKSDFKKLAKVVALLKKEINIEKYTKLSIAVEEISIHISEINTYANKIEIALNALKTVGTATIGRVLSASGTVAVATAVGEASTGTALSSLSGAAYTNALLSYLGGGSLAAGGFGIAGGTIVLSGIAIAPAVAILGIGADIISEKYLTSAKEYEKQVRIAIEKLNIQIKIIEKYIQEVEDYKNRFLQLRYRLLFNLTELEELIKGKSSHVKIEKKLLTVIYLTETLKNLMDNPLKENSRR
ncbi:hypothetical protein [Persephonella sp. KM09-Lau-8]|uniref:hypothetical protein n=1 Tax=Persephonella sp. KM09-Lau-8 TaxID=1158345 RepID=UPI000494F3FB|nr:hypothetical protein [Persephonella sp. KM09-Lau-8]